MFYQLGVVPIWIAHPGGSMTHEARVALANLHQVRSVERLVQVLGKDPIHEALGSLRPDVVPGAKPCDQDLDLLLRASGGQPWPGPALRLPGGCAREMEEVVGALRIPLSQGLRERAQRSGEDGVVLGHGGRLPDCGLRCSRRVGGFGDGARRAGIRSDAGSIPFVHATRLHQWNLRFAISIAPASFAAATACLCFGWDDDTWEDARRVPRGGAFALQRALNRGRRLKTLRTQRAFALREGGGDRFRFLQRELPRTLA